MKHGNLESEWKTKLVKEAKAEGWYARRIEDEFGVGFPDMVVKNSQGVAFVEAKIITGGKFGPSPRQYIDLVELHCPLRYSFGIVLGINLEIEGNRTTPLFYFSAPVKSISKADKSLTVTVDFCMGLEFTMEQLRRDS